MTDINKTLNEIAEKIENKDICIEAVFWAMSSLIDKRDDVIDEAIAAVKSCELVAPNVRRVRIDEAVGAIIKLIDNDALAMSCQSLGQYRSILKGDIKTMIKKESDFSIMMKSRYASLGESPDQIKLIVEMDKKIHTLEKQVQILMEEIEKVKNELG